jgi:hypothetical protein
MPEDPEDPEVREIPEMPEKPEDPEVREGGDVWPRAGMTMKWCVLLNKQFTPANQ